MPFIYTSDIQQFRKEASLCVTLSLPVLWVPVLLFSLREPGFSGHTFFLCIFCHHHYHRHYFFRPVLILSLSKTQDKLHNICCKIFHRLHWDLGCFVSSLIATVAELEFLQGKELKRQQNYAYRHCWSFFKYLLIKIVKCKKN